MSQNRFGNTTSKGHTRPGARDSEAKVVTSKAKKFATYFPRSCCTPSTAKWVDLVEEIFRLSTAVGQFRSVQ